VPSYSPSNMNLPPLAHRRSRTGCLTCKRRKVRCNEQRPLCHHCRRLNLDCVWKDQRPSPVPSSSADLVDFAQSIADPPGNLSLLQDIYLPDFGDLTAPGNPLHERVLSTDLDVLPPAPPQSESPIANVYVDDSLPLLVPPILDPVENGPRYASVRALFDSMAASSPMVRYSTAAFAAIQLYTTGEKADYRQYYDQAASELAERFRKSGSCSSSELRYVLTTIFFLTYINVCLPCMVCRSG
jgi:hypothetical protein